MSDIDTDVGFVANRGLSDRTLTLARTGVLHLPAYDGVGKRLFDLVCTVMLMPFVVPLVAILWLLSLLEGGRGLYGHLRIGRNGKPFTCWKIRTMRTDADGHLAACLAADPGLAAEWVRTQKLDNDPRITPFGHLLRGTSLDELPQLWNVLRGDMSLVGPRPVTADEIARYGSQRRFYLQCRPGLTGLWQVSGRNEASYDMRVAMDRRYAETISLTADMVLILRTVPAVLGRTGR